MDLTKCVPVADSGRRDVWLAARRGLLTASDLSAVLGLNPWKSALALYAEKVGAAPEPVENERMYWGGKLEAAIADGYGERTKRHVRLDGILRRSLVHPFLGATLDAVTVVEGRGDCPLEIKTTWAGGAADWDEDVPEWYKPQVQAQMVVVGAGFASVACLIAGQRMVWTDVERDDAVVEAIVRQGAEFWSRVERRDPPPPDGSESSEVALRMLHPKEDPTRDAVLLTRAALDSTDRMDAIDEQLAALEREKRELRQSIEAAIGEAPRGVLPDGAGSWRWVTESRKGYSVGPWSGRVLRRTRK